VSSESLRPTPFDVSPLPPLGLFRVLVIKIYIRKQHGDRGGAIAGRVESPGKLYQRNIALSTADSMMCSNSSQCWCTVTCSDHIQYQSE